MPRYSTDLPNYNQLGADNQRFCPCSVHDDVITRSCLPGVVYPVDQSQGSTELDEIMRRKSHMWRNKWESLCFTSCFILYIGLHVAGTTINQDDLLTKFKRFVVQYNRSYINNPEEYQFRMSVFEVSFNIAIYIQLY